MTDLLDGKLARHWAVESRLGKFLDPLADRLIIFGASIPLACDQRISWWALALLVIRIVILWLLRLLTARPLEFHVTLLGKLGAAMLFVSLIVLLATPRSLAWPPLIFWAAVATALSDI